MSQIDAWVATAAKQKLVRQQIDLGPLGSEEVEVRVEHVASKHAVEGLTKAAALEVAESGVHVNLVAPGPIEIGMLNRFTGTAEKKAALVAGVPVKRVGTPDEVAQTILFVASDKASFITGASIAVDGGKLAR